MERSVYGADCASTPTYLNKVTPTDRIPSRVRRSSLGSFFSGVWQTLSPSAANDVAGSAFRGGAWRWGKPEANRTQPERHSSDPAPQPPDCDPQLCECDCLCSAASLWPCRWTAPAWCPAVALYTLLFPVLFSPCCLSRFFLLSCFSISNLSSSLCFSSSSFSLKGEAGWCQCLSLLTSSLLSPCCYSTTIISSILLITNTFSSPPPSTASQVNTALSWRYTCSL